MHQAIKPAIEMNKNLPVCCSTYFPVGEKKKSKKVKKKRANSYFHRREKSKRQEGKISVE